MTQGARLLGLSTMQHACEKAYEVLHSHVDGDKRFLDAGGHWYFDFSDLFVNFFPFFERFSLIIELYCLIFIKK